MNNSPGAGQAACPAAFLKISTCMIYTKKINPLPSKAPGCWLDRLPLMSYNNLEATSKMHPCGKKLRHSHNLDTALSHISEATM